jgi:hypothetical protein
VQLRRRNVEAGRAGALERATFAAYARVFSSARLFGLVGRVARALQRWLGRSRVERWGRFLPALEAWTKYRTLPKPEPRAFRDSFEERST